MCLGGATALRDLYTQPAPLAVKYLLLQQTPSLTVSVPVVLSSSDESWPLVDTYCIPDTSHGHIIWPPSPAVPAACRRQVLLWPRLTDKGTGTGSSGTCSGPHGREVGGLLKPPPLRGCLRSPSGRTCCVLGAAG